MQSPIYSVFRLPDPPRSGVFAPILRLYDRWMGGNDWIRLERKYLALIPNPATWEQGRKITSWTTLIIPKGFICDGASIPRFFWRVIGTPKAFDYQAAALVHDYMYRYASVYMRPVSREYADAVLFALLASPRTRFRRWLIYYAVRLFGGRAWRRNSQDRYNSK